MNILFFDATNDWIIVKVYQTDKELYSYSGNHPRESSFRLITDISKALDSVGIEKPDRIVTCLGPGSFTGIRITVSTARNLAQIWNIPVTGIDSVEMTASWYFHKTGKPVLALLEGKQKKVYAGYFDGNYKGGFDLLPLDIPRVFSEEERNCVISNSELVQYGQKMNEIPDPGYIIKKRIKEIINADVETNNYNNLLPNYIRGSYVE